MKFPPGSCFLLAIGAVVKASAANFSALRGNDVLIRTRKLKEVDTESKKGENSKKKDIALFCEMNNMSPGPLPGWPWKKEGVPPEHSGCECTYNDQCSTCCCLYFNGCKICTDVDNLTPYVRKGCKRRPKCGNKVCACNRVAGDEVYCGPDNCFYACSNCAEENGFDVASQCRTCPDAGKLCEITEKDKAVPGVVKYCGPNECEYKNIGCAELVGFNKSKCKNTKQEGLVPIKGQVP